jgi:hypothetical protein
MLGHSKMILEQEPGKIAINPDRFDKLITALRTAVDNDGILDKESTYMTYLMPLGIYHVFIPSVLLCFSLICTARSDIRSHAGHQYM